MSLLQIYEPGQTPAPHASDAAPESLAVGIDLGTTHSVIACSSGQSVTVFSDAEGRRIIPSVVTYGDLVVRSIKRSMNAPATPIATPLGDKTPVEISADILRHMKAIAEAHLQQPISKAVITVPAYFDDAARTATRDAARLAGLEVLRLINEPTAAALAYGLDYTSPTGRGQNGEAILGEGKEAELVSPHPNPLTREKDTGVSFSRAQSPKGEGIYAIYDLGGGTFDISILRLEGGVFQVLATGGDTQLGGDDFDALLAEELQIDVMQARTIKESLSDVSAESQSSRIKFEALIAPLVAKTIHICERALADAKLQKTSIDGVVLVGGSTRVPLVRREVEAFFAQPPLTNIDPDEVVAVGAAIQAEALTVGADHLLLDVIPLSLGLETMGGIVDKLIERNTPIPVSVSQTFTTYQDGQTAMKIHVVQGEREMAADNRSLAEFELRGIPPLAANIARIEVSFTVDADGLLTVSAQESTTKTQQRIEVKPSYGLPLEVMAQMLRDSMEHAQADITQRLLIEVRVEAERLLYDLEQAMRKDPALLSEHETNLIYAQINNLRSAVGTDNREVIDAEMHRLNLLANDFAEKRMDKAITSALQGSHIDVI